MGYGMGIICNVIMLHLWQPVDVLQANAAPMILKRGGISMRPNLWLLLLMSALGVAESWSVFASMMPG